MNKLENEKRNDDEGGGGHINCRNGMHVCKQTELIGMNFANLFINKI